MLYFGGLGERVGSGERVDGKARFDDEFFKDAKRWSVESIVWKIAIRYRSSMVEVL